MNYVVDRTSDKAWEWNANKTQRMKTSTEQVQLIQRERAKEKKNLILIAFAFLIAPSSARRCYSISRLTLELIRGQTHLDDCCSGDRSDALRAYVEHSLKNADVASHHETACDGRIDVTATDMSESLEKEINREEK